MINGSLHQAAVLICVFHFQSVLLMLGSPASPRKRPFELLSDLVDDGGFGEDLHPERWDVSALDEMARYTKLGLGVGGELLACSEEEVLMGRWGRGREEEEQQEEEAAPPVIQEVQAAGAAAGREEGRSTKTEQELSGAAGGQDGGLSREPTVEVYQVAQEEEEAAAAGLALEHCSKEHNYSLSKGGEPGANRSTEEPRVGEAQQEAQVREESQAETELDLEDEEQEEDEEGTEETPAEAELSSSSDSECGELCLHRPAAAHSCRSGRLLRVRCLHPAAAV